MLIPLLNNKAPVLVTVEKEPVAVSLENLRHASKLPRARRNDDLFPRTAIEITASVPQTAAEKK
jgi:hypothetical protein